MPPGGYQLGWSQCETSVTMSRHGGEESVGAGVVPRDRLPNQLDWCPPRIDHYLYVCGAGSSVFTSRKFTSKQHQQWAECTQKKSHKNKSLCLISVFPRLLSGPSENVPDGYMYDLRQSMNRPPWPAYFMCKWRAAVNSLHRCICTCEKTFLLI